MTTQLIMTVGTNALPVWVAWYHLKDKLEPPINKVRFIHTTDTVSQKDLLVTHCSSADFGRHIKTSPGNPGTVRGDIRNRILNGLDENTTHLHVHYTGGTQVMGVETVSAIEERLANNPDGKNVELDTTYLDARGGSGPCLISRRNGVIKIKSKSDARNNINVDLNHIAFLNGFTLAPFDIERRDSNGRKYNHEYHKNGNWKKEYLPSPARLDQNQKQEGVQVLHEMGFHESWKDGRITNLKDSTFEYAAYVALKQALKDIKNTPNSNRSNYKIYHKVYVKRTGANIQDKEFELDVVAILGYQIVLVSCTLHNKSDKIKEKGMEALHRVRQLGGDEAQAIVLCKAHPNDAKRVEKELHDEVGSAGKPLRIWGTDEWKNLQREFTDYLSNDLHWR